MPTGRVKWFNESKGFGFILPDEQGPDLFVHRSEVQGEPLRDGEAVEFEQVKGPKGLKAIGVRRV